MKVVVPYSRHAFGTTVVLRGDGIEPRLELCNQEDSYYKLMVKLWAEHEQFITVEHDVMPWPGAIQQLWDCPEPWCGNTYYMRGKLGVVAFGCTKFSVELIDKMPWIWELVARPANFDGSLEEPDPLRTHWAVLDGLWRDLVDLNFPDLKPHLHNPPVVHMNELHFPYYGDGQREAIKGGDNMHWLGTREGVVIGDPAELERELREHAPSPAEQFARQPTP